jgi:hypothetical protein
MLRERLDCAFLHNLRAVSELALDTRGSLLTGRQIGIVLR